MMRKLCVLVVLILFINEVHSQDLVFSQPIKLGSQINSDDEELGALVSADGNTMYFSRAFHAYNEGGKFAGTDIWVSKKDANGQWLPAANMGSKWNNKRSNSVIGINKDNTVVYLLNAYSNRSGISFSKFYGGEWQLPEFIPIPGINRDDFVGFYANSTFDVIMISMKGKDSFGEEDLYVSLKDSFGNWTEPKNLGPTVNTKDFEISPFLTEDKKRLFFSSNGHGGYGDADIFYCDRLFDSWETWSVPKNLGDKVNSPAFDGYFSLYDSVGYFSSSRNRTNADIFKTKLDKGTKALVFDRLYLTPKEVGELIGNSVSRKFVFEKGLTELNSGQKELLYYIANKLVTKTEIKFQLTTLGAEDTKTMQVRLTAMINQLTSAGIDGGRIRLVSQANEGKLEPNTIEIILFK